MNQPNPNVMMNNSGYYTSNPTNPRLPIDVNKSGTQQINLGLYHPAYHSYPHPSQLHSGSTLESPNHGVLAPPSIPPPPIPSHPLLATPDPSISVHLAQELRELGHQLGLTEEDLATLPSSPSLRSATNPNTKLFDESEQRFFDNFLDNIFFDENLFADNPLPPTLEHPNYFPPGPSLPTGSNSHMFSLDKPQHKSVVHSSLYDMFNHNSREPSMHSTPTPTTPSSLFMGHDSGVSSVENNPPRTHTPTNNPIPLKSPMSHTRRNSTMSSPLHINTESISLNSPVIPVKRKGSDMKSRKPSMKREYDINKGLNESSIESPSSLNNETKQEEFPPDSQSPTSSNFESKREETSKADRSRKGNKELLTEEEKRANHIASEQKRRNMIRSGFKDLTEIVPSLRDMNNSKSTILFKAVDFIKRLERKNQRLKNKATTLQRRLEGAQTGSMYPVHNGHHHQPPPPPPPGRGGGESNPGPGGQGYMYGYNYGNNPSFGGSNGNYFGGGAPGDSVNQYSTRTILPNYSVTTNCRVDIPSATMSQESTADGSRRPTASRS
ncbi:hypothetical protein K7432_000749 [Basidiobolus ranarum]|uniref:BHLH domain-containing protein n=1 Tax=Basidiobolus ranarum TaxID=34480 RepID=A0ABR2X434_9FUNG